MSLLLIISLVKAAARPSPLMLEVGQSNYLLGQQATGNNSI